MTTTAATDRSTRCRPRAMRSVAVAVAVAALLSEIVPGTAVAPAAAAACSDSTIAYGGGDGSPGTPYLISTVTHLQQLRDRVNADVSGTNYEDCYFKQTADLDLAGLDWVAIGTDTSSSSRTKFFGHYDGDFHRIQNLRIRTADPEVDYYGLFGYVRHGSIKNLRLTGVDIQLSFVDVSDDRYVGALAGRLNSSNSGSPSTIVGTVSVQGTVIVSYLGDEDLYVGGVIGRGGTQTRIDDRIAFIGDISGRFGTTGPSKEGNYGGLVGRTSQDATLTLGYAAANVTVTAEMSNAGDIYAGVLTGTTSSNESVLEELYAVGSATINGTAPAGKGYYAGAVGYIGNEEDEFLDIFYLDTIRGDKAFFGGAEDGFPESPGGLFNVLSRTDAQMRLAQPASTMTRSSGTSRWVYNNDPVSPDPAGNWFLVLDPGPGEYPYPVFFWEIDPLKIPSGTSILAQNLGWSPTVSSTLTPTAGPTGPLLTCAPTDPPIGMLVTCDVTGGDPDIDILWLVTAGDIVIGSTGVRLDGDGNGRFSFVVPRSALGLRILVELVEWTLPLDIGVAGGPVPQGIPAGEGAPAWPGFAAAFAALALMLAPASGRTRGRRHAGRVGTLQPLRTR